MENNTYIKDYLTGFLKPDGNEIVFSLYDGLKVSDITYAQFLEDILRCAGFFSRLASRGKHIALIAPNSYNWLVCFFGILASGNVVVPLNQALPAATLTKQMEHADISVVCCCDANKEALKQLSPHLKYFSLDENIYSDAIGLDDIYCPGSDETMLMVSTSGTTGESKLAEFTYVGLENSVMLSRPDFDVIFRDIELKKYYLCLPLFHTGGLITLLSIIRLRVTACLGRGLTHVFEDLSVFNPDATSLVPAIMEVAIKLMKQTSTPREIEKILGNRMKVLVTGSASISTDSCAYVMDQGFKVFEYYGMTETGGLGTRCILDADHLGSIGTAYGGISCRIEDGELLMSGPSLMKGYYKDPAGTAAILKDGWLYTGDLARQDDDGYFYIIGRKKNVIILSNGENVNPEEIEAALSVCPDVLECMVYGDKKGILADVYTNDEKNVAAFVKKYNEQVPMYRQIYKVNYSDTPLEKTGIGKIKRKENEYV